MKYNVKPRIKYKQNTMERTSKQINYNSKASEATAL